MNTIGWMGTVCLGMCGAPQAIRSARDGNSDGLDMTFLILWTLGEILTLFAILKDAPLKYLVYNYGANLMFLAIMWKYKLFPRKK